MDQLMHSENATLKNQIDAAYSTGSFTSMDLRLYRFRQAHTVVYWYPLNLTCPYSEQRSQWTSCKSLADIFCIELDKYIQAP